MKEGILKYFYLSQIIINHYIPEDFLVINLTIPDIIANLDDLNETSDIKYTFPYFFSCYAVLIFFFLFLRKKI